MKALVIVLYFLLFLIGILLAVVVASSVLLALGTGLAMLFPVTPLEATAVTVVVAIAVVAVYFLIKPREEPEETVEEETTEKEARIYLSSMHLPKPRGGKKYRH